MKQRYTAVELDDIRCLLYDLNAFYELETTYESIPKALLTLKTNHMTELAEFLKIGLAHENDLAVTKDQIELWINIENRMLLTEQVIHAISIALPNNKKESNQASTSNATENDAWEWDWIYYIGTVLLGMSEAVFWRCTPQKLFALWDVHKRYHGLTDNEAQQPSTSYLDQFI